MLKVKIKEGVIADLITPLDNSGELCLRSARNLADYARFGGCKGVLVGGAMGGFPHTDVKTRMRMATQTAQFGLPTIVHVSHQDEDIEPALALHARANHASAVALSIDGVTWDEGIESVIARIKAVVDAASHLPTLLMMDDARWISASHFAQICGARLISGVIARTSFEERYADMKRWTQMFGLDGALFCADDYLLPAARRRGIRRLISPSATVYPEAIRQALNCFCGNVHASPTYHRELLRCVSEARGRAQSWSLPLHHATLYAMNIISSPIPPPPHEPLDEAHVNSLKEGGSLAL